MQNHTPSPGRRAVVVQVFHFISVIWGIFGGLVLFGCFVGLFLNYTLSEDGKVISSSCPLLQLLPSFYSLQTCEDQLLFVCLFVCFSEGGVFLSVNTY